MDLDLKVKFRVVAQILKESEFKHVILYRPLQSDPTVSLYEWS
jgi:hypothetical protein